MSKPVAKANVYDKRRLNGIPVPMEVDSDSDFVAGPIREVEKVDKSKKHTRTKKSGAKSRSQIPFIVDSDEEGGPSTVKRKASRKKATNSRVKRARKARSESEDDNPLLAYFADRPHLLAAVNDADDESEEVSPDEEEEEEDLSGSGLEKQREPEEPVILKSMIGYTCPRPKIVAPVVPAAAESVTEDSSSEERTKVKPAEQQEGSVTESSTDDGRPYIRAPPYIRPRSRSCSTTESSTGEEDAKPAKHVGGKRVADEDIQHDINKRRKVDPKASDDSDITTTEDDTDNESYAIDSKNQPRPSFPNAPKPMGPHVLDKAAKIYIPNAMNRFLRPYQREGVEFFFRQYKIGRGGVLGDDMGLGKTIQVIAFLSAIMDKSGLKGDRERRHRHVARLQERANWRSDMPPANATWPTCLVAAPTSVVGNWEREFEKWGYFEVGVYSTALKKSERADMLRDFKLGRLDVLIVSHALLRRDIDQFDELALSVIFLDEAHLIKRKDAGLTQAMNRFNCQCRFALTGTLIQNSYMEMWAVLDFTNPKQLGHKRHWNRFIAKPLIKGQSASASAEERQRQDEVAEILTKVILPKFFLRRTKDLIKHQLPNKTDEVVFCPLAPLQRKVYKRVLRLPEVQNLIHKDDPCPSCNSGKPRKSCCHAFEPETLFIFMHVLIALANHLALLLPGPNDSQEQVQRYTSLTERVMMGIYADENKRHKIAYSTAIMRGDMCGKWKILRGLLAEWRTEGTNKVLIFTKSIKLLEMLEFQLKADSYEFRKLEGSTPQKDRMGYIDEFNNDPSVFAFLISTLAGGTGINLTGANKVVIFDPNWNPAHDLQAMDRAFRFGQTRDVSVYRLLGGGSLEELVYARQLYKQQQMAIGYDASAQTRYFDGVQGDPQKQGELFGIKNMFTYHEDEQTTKMAIERATIAELDFALGQPSAPKTKGKKSSLGRDEAADLRGLGAFMFDDLAGGAKRRTQTAEQRILSAGGVKYSHRNDELVKGAPRKSTGTSPTKKPRASTKGKSKAAVTKPDPNWPPKRGVKIRAAKAAARAAGVPYIPPGTNPAGDSTKSYKQRLVDKYEVLISLGIIAGPENLGEYAREFDLETEDQKKKILARLEEVLSDQFSQIDGAT